jgi:LPS sulfotransferase NodH
MNRDITLRQSYLICTLPRSGSWLLCSLLRSAGIAGKPAEHFHRDLLKSAGPGTTRHHLRRAIAAGIGANGVFGAKVHWSQFAALARLPDVTGTAGLATLFADQLRPLQYIWLMRRNKARQAISYYRAIHTGSWWRVTGKDQQPARREPAYDFDTIHRYEQELTRQDGAWQAYFEGFDFDPEVIVYEELRQQPAAIATEVLQSMGLSAELGEVGEPPLSPQSDGTSEEWLERYLATKAARLAGGRPRRLPQSERKPMSRNVANRREFRVAAIQRSGHHGIINWIAGQAEMPTLFLNDAQPRTNPFFTCTIASLFDTPAGARRLARTCLAPYAPRAGLVHNYEDRALADVFSDDFENHHDHWVGVSADRSDIIVVRDPFNTFASRMIPGWMRHKLSDETERATLVTMWKEYAREALGLTTSMRRNGVAILFNRWLVDLDYRRSVAELLGLGFSDAGFGKVSGDYGGSSFDGVRFDGFAARMPLTQRWTHFVDDPLFRSIFADTELVELSEALFGRIAGTEVLWQDSRAVERAPVQREADEAMVLGRSARLVGTA